MSKRNKQQTMYQPSGPAKRHAMTGKTNPKSGRNGSSGAHSTKRPAPPLPRAANGWNLMSDIVARVAKMMKERERR
jgi:hypothetical protein